MKQVRIGNTFRATRVELRLRQSDVAERAGASQQTVSDVECGRFGGISIDTYCRIAAVLDADVQLAPRWRGPKLDRILDKRHAFLQNRTAQLLASIGWEVATEVPFNRYGDRGSVDILGWRADSRVLLIVEIKSEIASLEETLRVLNMKRCVVPIAVRTERGWDAAAVATVLVLPDSSTHRDLVRRHAALVSASLPKRGWDVRHWLAEPVGDLSGVMFLRDTGEGGAMRNVSPTRRVRGARLAPKPDAVAVAGPIHAQIGTQEPARPPRTEPNPRLEPAPRRPSRPGVT